VVAALLIGGLAVTSLLAAASLRLESLSASLLAAYVVLLAEAAALTAGLSPLRAVTRSGLAGAEGGLLPIAVAIWWLRGRPRLSAVRLRPFRDPLVLGFAALAVVVLGYELALVLTAPPNNWDSLTYHLTRAAFWAQHDGIYWVPNAPTNRINEFQPLAEQQVLYLFVATGSGALFALPQFVAELATMVAIYTAARRLGHEVRGAFCAAVVFGTFAVVALESTTAQNDLVAAALPAVAAAFLLGRRDSELALAGVAVGLAVGVKLTTALVVPVLLLLAGLRGRRALALFAGAGAAGFCLFSLWSFVLNAVETGRLTWHSEGQLSLAASPSFPGSVSTAVRVLYRVIDLPAISHRTAWGFVAAAGVAVLVLLLARRRTALLAGAVLALPGLVLLVAGATHGIARIVHLPANPAGATAETFFWTVNQLASEDFAGFGPLGLLLLAAPVVGIVQFARGRADARRLALALALPIFVVLLSFEVQYYDFLTRFVIVPAALTVPLLAALFRRTEVGVAVLTVAAASVGLALVHDLVKPLDSRYGHPWQLSLANAVRLNWMPAAGEALDELDQDADGASVGAVLGPDEPGYLLFGPGRRRQVRFLSPLPEQAVEAARTAALPFVVVGGVQGVGEAFQRAGWRLQPLGIYWNLAIRS